MNGILHSREASFGYARSERDLCKALSENSARAVYVKAREFEPLSEIF